jgi:hypothetical protein
MVSLNSRKRKRVAALSPTPPDDPEWDDCIEVIPRQITVDGESTERTPLAESHTRGNQARRARTASHVQGMPFTSSTLSMINS